MWAYRQKQIENNCGAELLGTLERHWTTEDTSWRIQESADEKRSCSGNEMDLP